MQRAQALNLLHQYINNPAMINHSLASEAVMRALADRLDEDVELWGLAGLLHDLDTELVNADPKVHGLKTAEILLEFDIDPLIIDAIKMHNEEATGEVRTTKFHHALACSETITGLITTTALVYPDKQLAPVKVKSITKRMKQKAFAASVNREVILECEKVDVPLNDFAELALSAMKEIAKDIGL